MQELYAHFRAIGTICLKTAKKIAKNLFSQGSDKPFHEVREPL